MPTTKQEYSPSGSPIIKGGVNVITPKPPVSQSPGGTWGTVVPSSSVSNSPSPSPEPPKQDSQNSLNR